MHYGHLILVEADTHGEAIEAVNDGLTDYGTSDFAWSDWSQIGGRWEEDMPEGAVNYAADPARAESLIAQFSNYRTDKIAALRESASDLRTIERDTLGGGYEFDGGLYDSHLLAQLLLDYYFQESFIYDLAERSTKLQYARTRIAATPERQWLVLVDFHS